MKMSLNASRTEQFAEALYFLVISSPVADRIRALARRHGVSDRALREEVLLVGRRWANGAGGDVRKAI